MNVFYWLLAESSAFELHLDVTASPLSGGCKAGGFNLAVAALMLSGDHETGGTRLWPSPLPFKAIRNTGQILWQSVCR